MFSKCQKVATDTLPPSNYAIGPCSYVYTVDKMRTLTFIKKMYLDLVADFSGDGLQI